MGNIRSFSLSAEGADHIKNGAPCQDASLDNDVCGDGAAAIAVVADGHGSPQYFRSDIGSKIAADVALKGIKEFLKLNPETPGAFADGNSKTALDRLARHVISAWYTCVADVDNASPLSDDAKMADLEEKYRSKYLNDPDRQYFCHAYGTTLIAAAMKDDYWFGIQIGDGKCEVLYEDGMWRQPIPWDDKCFLNSTTSICDDDAINEFRYWLGFRQTNGAYAEYRYGISGQNKDEVKFAAAKPVAIFIGTDGVDDTYPVHENEKHLVYLYRAIVLSIADKGFDVTKEQTLELAKKMAEQGSRDDVSIACIVGDICAGGALIDELRMQSEAEAAAAKEAATAKEAEKEAVKEAANVVDDETVNEAADEVAKDVDKLADDETVNVADDETVNEAVNESANVADVVNES